MGWGKGARILLWTLAILLILPVAGLLVMTMLEWRPESQETTPVTPPVHGSKEPVGEPPGTLSLLSFNIGYAGLGRDADFFMDGGRQVRPRDRELVLANLHGLREVLAGRSEDVILLQEVDQDSSRSFGIDQVAFVAEGLPDHYRSRSLNFKVPWIPYPLLEPLGRVESGLLAFSLLEPKGARRLQLPGLPAWPVRMFHLKRCVHELRLAGPAGRDWVILHLHLSAFDKDGGQRRAQMAYLRKHMLALAAEGHLVIVAGDWNHAPPGWTPGAGKTPGPLPFWFQQVPTEWTPAGWSWGFDPVIPSLRATSEPYRPGQTFVTTVDAFLVSPDLTIETVEAIDLGFAHSDHHPVRARVRWRGKDGEGEPVLGK